MRPHRFGIDALISSIRNRRKISDLCIDHGFQIGFTLSMEIDPKIDLEAELVGLWRNGLT